IIVRAGARAQEVHLVISTEREVAGVGLEQRTDTALTAGKVQLGGLVLGRARKGNVVERRVDVRVDRALPPHTFKREERDRSDTDALVVQRHWILDLALELRLVVDHRLLQAGVRGLHVSYGALERLLLRAGLRRGLLRLVRRRGRRLGLA